MTVQEKARWALVLFLALVTSVSAVYRIVLVGTNTQSVTLPSMEASRPGATVTADTRYNESPGWTYLHLFPGLTFMILGPLQFSSRIRAKRLNVHRWSGRIFLFVSITAAVVGMIMAAQPSTYIGANAAAAAWFFGGLSVFCAVKAFYHVRRKEILLHREWMIRTFAIGLGVSTVRLVAVPLFALTDLPLQEVMGISFWTGWGITMIGAEIWINLTRAPLHAAKASVY